ncbi:hypothetical protein C3B58_07000 [Lactonifactor longoviformis]|uniref:Prepilin-type N-terminal cleavage/methylation domain-containing protein n=1 Tax=Lactonifactor longoviformis DSM 17459 TaxID=1122155 RepID=A0A1M4T2B4_9CLOT|nr:prepilin-type N-terminal cleavage/methylation domain-containing protein [Lactonifactor longoviformis]POP33539.1 hypothetical protein C3B58_07000 [Lactonifactor longoviformis]SHE38457.1 hypothetical protein SAMN02745158_00385 [Lactonifactor longoviformis DSM 17459]
MNELKKTNGTTLVELMVAFAIAGIFMVSAAMLVSSFTNVYLRIINRNRIQDISNVVMEKVVEELTYASETATEVDADRVKGSVMLSGEDSDGNYLVAEYSNKDGNPVRMSTQADGEGNQKGLLLEYQPIYENNSPDGAILYEGSQWYMGKGFYKKNQVDVRFRKIENTACIQVTLTVSDEKGRYKKTTEKCVECIDLDPNDVQVEGS